MWILKIYLSYVKLLQSQKVLRHFTVFVTLIWEPSIVTAMILCKPDSVVSVLERF